MPNPLQTESSVSVHELHRRLNAGLPARLLDVRTSGEYAAAHVSGTTLIPLDQLDPIEFLRQRGADSAPVYLLCQSGGRAQRAIDQLSKAGVTGCVLVEGGTQAWKDAGFPLICGKSRVLPLMRQVQVVVGLLSATGSVLVLTVHPYFVLIPLVMGCCLLFAGLTGFCGLALVLAKMPWNKSTTCQSGN